MDDDFDWFGDKSVVVRSYGDLAVYRNPNGDFVIRQQGDAMQRDDNYIVIPRSNLEVVINALRALVDG